MKIDLPPEVLDALYIAQDLLEVIAKLDVNEAHQMVLDLLIERQWEPEELVLATGFVRGLRALKEDHHQEYQLWLECHSQGGAEQLQKAKDEIGQARGNAISHLDWLIEDALGWSQPNTELIRHLRDLRETLARLPDRPMFVQPGLRAPQTYENGYYWLQLGRGQPEIVRVAMDYQYRKKVVPYVLATHWKGPLSDVLNDQGQFRGPINPPEFDPPEDPA